MATPTDYPSTLSFEQSLENLAAIVHELEDGQVGLTDSLVKYEQGVRLLKQCYELLQKAERRIELLTRMEASGEAVTEPFDDSPSASQPAGESARSRRRATKSAQKGPPDTQLDSFRPGNGGDDPSAMDVKGGLF